MRRDLTQFDEDRPDVRYEQLKREWVQAHPEATSAEYEAAMTRLAAEAGA